MMLGAFHFTNNSQEDYQKNVKFPEKKKQKQYKAETWLSLPRVYYFSGK